MRLGGHLRGSMPVGMHLNSRGQPVKGGHYVLLEGQHVERKSLKSVDSTGGWGTLAKACVAFANTNGGGTVLVGIEDGEADPPEGQSIAEGDEHKIQQRLEELTVNVNLLATIVEASNGAEYVSLKVNRSHSAASTKSGKYYVRIGDRSMPVVGEDIMRLMSDHSSQPWETLTSTRVPRSQVDKGKQKQLVSKLKASEKVRESVKGKSARQLLDHYMLADGECLTNLGVVCIGRRSDRAKLGVAPTAQFIKWDERGNKTNKMVWHDHDMSPMELVDEIWNSVPDFNETYEVIEGMAVRHVPAFNEDLIREILINALVHRPYTQGGDIFIKLTPEKLEITNPGSLPTGVTPENVLQTTVRRNENMAKLFHDLNLMEKEGSGFDKMYDILLSQGRPVPKVRESHNTVILTLERCPPDSTVVNFISAASGAHSLRQMDRIVLGLITEGTGITARSLAKRLGMDSAAEVKERIEHLSHLNLVSASGNGSGRKYFVDPETFQNLGVQGSRSKPVHIEPHRLAAFVEEDVYLHPMSRIGEIHARIGDAVSRSAMSRILSRLVEQGRIVAEKDTKGRRYRFPGSKPANRAGD